MSDYESVANQLIAVNQEISETLSTLRHLQLKQESLSRQVIMEAKRASDEIDRVKAIDDLRVLRGKDSILARRCPCGCGAILEDGRLINGHKAEPGPILASATYNDAGRYEEGGRYE